MIVTDDQVILFDATRELWTSTNETISWKNELNRLGSLDSRETKESFALSSLTTSIVVAYHLEGVANELEFPTVAAQSVETMTIFADSKMTVDSI